MLEAKKSAWFEKVFALYNRHLLKRRFNSLQVFGLDFLKNEGSATPQVIYANHSGWWDGLVLWEIFKNFEFENYVMMEEKHLRKLFLFRYLGAFSVVREKPREAVKSVNYAAGLLKQDLNRAVLIFPQGEILPNDVRPLRFYNGLGKIVGKVGQCSAVPIALRYEFLGNFKPEIFVKIGAPSFHETDLHFDAKKSNADFQARLTATLDDLKRDIISNNLTDYARLF